MKYKATHPDSQAGTPIEDMVVAIECQPWPAFMYDKYVIYAKMYTTEDDETVWATITGRVLNSGELAAIEQIPIRSSIKNKAKP